MKGRFKRGAGVLTLLALLAVGVVRPAYTAPRDARGTLASRRGVVSRAAAAGAAATGSGSVVSWGNPERTPLPEGLDNIISIAGGDNHSIALRSDGTVMAWGRTNAGSARTVPAGLAGVTAISTSADFNLALKSDGTVVAWGDNGFGQTDVPSGLSEVTAVSAGHYHGLALRSNGSVVGWGRSTSGQISIPADLTAVRAVSAGWLHSLALQSNGTVKAWGHNMSGQASVPPGLSGVVAIAAGGLYSAALKSDGTVVCWGEYHDGSAYRQMVTPAGLSHVIAIAAGFGHCLALKSDGTVAAWGRNDDGQATTTGLTGVTAVSGGIFHSLALRANSKVRYWGRVSSFPGGFTQVKAVAQSLHGLVLKSNGTVQAWGFNDQGQANVPVGLSGVKAVEAGSGFSLVLKDDGTVAAWGRDNEGQVSGAAGLTDIIAISTNTLHCLALKSDGTVVAWGLNIGGQADVPVGLRGVVAIEAGSEHSLALKADGTVVAWGRNVEGQTTLPGGLDHVTALAAGSAFSLALKSDGTIVGWGSNSSQQLEVPADLGKAVAISAGNSHAVALRDNGTVAAWGDSREGTTTVPSDLTGVTALSALYGTMAVAGNQAPTINPPGSNSTFEDTTLGPLSFTVGDDDGASAVTLSATSSDPGLIQSFNFGGSGANRTVTLVPAPNANGTAIITLTAGDGLASTDAVFVLTVLRVNDAPSFTVGGDQTVSEDAGPQSVPGWATNRRPGPTNDEFTQNLTFEVTSNSNAALFSAGPAINATTGELTYTPAPNANGEATVTVRLRDDGGTANGGKDTSATQSFTIQVNPVNDLPTAIGQSATTDEDTAKALVLEATDIDGDSMNYIIVTRPAHGTLSGFGANRTYTPAANYHGPDSFTFRMFDGTGVGNTATVSLTVTPVNDAPVATGESYATLRGTLLEVAAPGVLGNDTDVEGDSLTAQLVTSAAGGSLTLNSNGSFRYTPRIGFSGTDTFTYRAHDGTAAGNTVTVRLQVSAEPPASTPDAQVEATGTIAVSGGNGTFTLSARKTAAKVQGAFTYTDPVRTRTLTSTELTAVVVTGRKARVFGIGKLVTGALVDFVVDVEDLAEPGRGKDRFQLEIGNGQTAGGVLSFGNITIRP